MKLIANVSEFVDMLVIVIMIYLAHCHFFEYEMPPVFEFDHISDYDLAVFVIKYSCVNTF